MSDFQKTILITGCSSGIGKAAAHTLRTRGYRVFATARRAEDVETLIADGFDATRLDLDDSESIESAVDYVQHATNGHLYALFNNGAYGQPGAVEDLSRDVLRAQFETNLFGTHELTCRVIPMMRANGEGRIVQNSSILGLVSLPYRSAYNATKFALEGLSDALRTELHGSGITVSIIEPGPIISAFRRNAQQKFERNITIEGSPHQPCYEAMAQRLAKKGAAVPGTLGPEAVVKKLILALESKRPKARYHVTWPTTLLATMKRFLPDYFMDRVCRRLSD